MSGPVFGYRRTRRSAPSTRPQPSQRVVSMEARSPSSMRPTNASLDAGRPSHLEPAQAGVLAQHAELARRRVRFERVDPTADRRASNPADGMDRVQQPRLIRDATPVCASYSQCDRTRRLSRRCCSLGGRPTTLARAAGRLERVAVVDVRSGRHSRIGGSEPAGGRAGQGDARPTRGRASRAGAGRPAPRGVTEVVRAVGRSAAGTSTEGCGKGGCARTEWGATLRGPRSQRVYRSWVAWISSRVTAGTASPSS